MQTTAVFVEQLLIGVFAVLTVVSLAAPQMLQPMIGANAGLAVLLLGGAYVAGIIYDRYSDTLLEDLETHQRLLTALNEWEKTSTDCGRNAKTEAPPQDPFPEDLLRLALLNNEQLSVHGSYLRSRIRLTRAVATLLPALAIGVVVLVVGAAAVPNYRALAVVVLLAYAIPFVAALAVKTSLPRTERLTNLEKYTSYRNDFHYEGKDSAGRVALRALVRSRAMMAALVLTVVAVVLLWGVRPRLLAALPVAGFVAMLFVGWTWWRITNTFHSLLTTMARRDLGARPCVPTL